MINDLQPQRFREGSFVVNEKGEMFKVKRYTKTGRVSCTNMDNAKRFPKPEDLSFATENDISKYYNIKGGNSKNWANAANNWLKSGICTTSKKITNHNQ